MRKRTFIMTCVFILTNYFVSICQTTIVDTIKIIPEKVDTNYFTKSGLYLLNTNVPNGKWRIFYTNEQLYAEYLVVNKKLEGTIISYWPNGKVFAIEKNINGLLDGTRCLFHPNGEISVMSFWDKGKGIGKWRFYNFKGKLYKTKKATDPSLGLNSPTK